MQPTKLLLGLHCSNFSNQNLKRWRLFSRIITLRDNGPFLMMPVICLLKDGALVFILSQWNLFQSGDATEEQGSWWVGLQSAVWSPLPGDDHRHRSLHRHRVPGIPQVWGSRAGEHHSKPPSCRYVSHTVKVRGASL